MNHSDSFQNVMIDSRELALIAVAYLFQSNDKAMRILARFECDDVNNGMIFATLAHVFLVLCRKAFVQKKINDDVLLGGSFCFFQPKPIEINR
jgi:hypothetical protein